MSRGRRWWTLGAVGAVALLLVGQKCMCPDPAVLFRQQMNGAAEVHGAALRAPPPAPVPAAAPVAQATNAAAPTPTAAQPVARMATVAPDAPRAAVAAAPPAQMPAPVAETAKPAAKTECRKLTWDDISKFNYVPPRPAADDALTGTSQPEGKGDPVPDAVLAMSGGRYAIEGYAVPLDYDHGVVTRFILISAPLACCFAEAPPMNKWITVTNSAKAEFECTKYGVVRVSGVFDVGEETREGYVVGLYRMRAEKVVNVEP